MLGKAEFRGGLLTLGGLLLVVLALIQFQPGFPGELLLQSLRFHILAAGFVLALLIVTLGARWRGVALALVVLAVAVHDARYVLEFQNRRFEPSGAPLTQFEFLSFNVLTGNRTSTELVEAIVADPPDVALIMETPGIEEHLERLAQALPHRAGCDDPRKCDISLHSRIPFESVEVRTLPPLNRQRLVIGKLNVDGQSVTIVGVHLTKPHYDGISEAELWHINRVLEGIDGPLVLAGDFNAASWSSTLLRIGERQNLAPGPWQPATWPVRLGPLGVPIDNMFTRGSAQLIHLEAGDSIGSNHRPLRAIVGLYGEP